MVHVRVRSPAEDASAAAAAVDDAATVAVPLPAIDAAHR